MKTNLNMIAMLLLMSVAASPQARPLDAAGPCPQEAKLSIADGAYKGDAHAMGQVTGFAEVHAQATRNEPAWMQSMQGHSGKNRMYRMGTHQVILVTLCNPDDCERNRAYIAYEPATGAYAGKVYEGRHVRDIGASPTDPVSPDRLGQALVCAQNLDWGRK